MADAPVVDTEPGDKKAEEQQQAGDEKRAGDEEQPVGNDQPNNYEEEQAVRTMLQRLQGNPETKGFYEVFAAVMYKAPATPLTQDSGTGDAPTTSRDDSTAAESPPATFKAPTGQDFYIAALCTFLIVLVVAYVLSAGMAAAWALINMMMRKCGQEYWKSDGDTACNAKVVNAFALSIETRCLSEKPAAMLQSDFDEKCSAYYVDVLWTVGAFLLLAGGFLYRELGKMSHKVTFHEKLFVVKSWHGKLFECSFYGDITAAKKTSDGLKLSTRAKITTGKGGGDADEAEEGKWCGGSKKPRALDIEGDATITVLCGGGEKTSAFLGEFAKRLPVSIEGFDGVSAAPARGSASLLDGRLGQLVKARRGEQWEPQAVRKPVSCDMCTEVVIIVVVVAVGFYVFSVFTNIIGWAVANGKGDCSDDLRPGVDMCAFVRVFWPVEFPLVTVQDYVNVVALVVAAIALPIWMLMQHPFEYRFHEGHVVEQRLFAAREFQESEMFAPADIESLELVWTFLEKYVKASVGAIYTVKQGIAKPFEVKARFAPGMSMKIGIPDSECASCSGHGAMALNYKDRIIQSLNEMKPGLLPAPEADA